MKIIIYFVFNIQQASKCGVFRSRFTEADVKCFMSGALRTITNITKSMVN